MIDAKKIEEMADKFSQSIPPGAKAFQQDIEKNFKQMLQSLLAKMDLVTREEFDVQSKVLARTREKIEVMEKKLAEIESQIASE
jgi:BMFP domain-containing protein YqiC